MTKVMFGKTTKTNVVLKYKKIKDNIFVYKLKYKVKNNSVDTYGICFEEDLSGLEKNLLIPKKLALYNVYHKEFLDVIRKNVMVLEQAHKIDLKEFFNKDESLIPIGEDCVILRGIHPIIPEYSIQERPLFYYNYENNNPMPTAVHLGLYNAKKYLEPVVIEDNYELEESLKILKKRKDISFGIYEPIRKVEDVFLFIDEIEFAKKYSDDILEKQFLEFTWMPTEEDWLKYFGQLENYGLDLANQYLVDKILKLKKK